jgi:hypothetical protein
MGIDLKVEDKEWEIIQNFMTAVMGMLIALTPIIILESSFDFVVAVILVFLNNAIILDDWWMTSKAIKKYKLETGIIISLTIVYYHLLIFLTVWLLAAGNNKVPLNGYLLVLITICIVDIIWCRILWRSNPNLDKEDKIQISSWIIMDFIGIFIYAIGFLWISSQNFSLLYISIFFCILYLLRRFLDEIACHMMVKTIGGLIKLN